MGSADDMESRQSRDARTKQEKMANQQQKQAQANTTAWLAGLVVIAVLSFFALGALVAQRDAHAASWAGLTTRVASRELAMRASAPGGADPLALLALGIARSATRAADALREHDAMATSVAADGAMRAADVARDRVAEPARSVFDNAYRLIQRARSKRQNGDPDRAADLLRQVSSMLASIPPGVPEAPRNPGGYSGARLINATGATIGVVDHVSMTRSGQASTVTVVIGGYHHVLGFLDFGGTRLTVPVGRLVFGKTRVIGPTRVVLASMAQTASEIRGELDVTPAPPSR